MLTAPFGKEPLSTVLEFARDSDIRCLEVMAGPGSLHLDPSRATAKELDTLKGTVDNAGLEITALAYYTNTSDSKQSKEIQAHAKKTIDAAARLGVPTVCMLAGWPVEGMTKVETIRKVLPKAFKPILEHARKKNINIALENYFATCLQGIDTFEAIFEAIPDANFGLNYDPSHLVHQECDYFLPVSLFKDRIFHTHAKDTYIDHGLRAKVGIYGTGWWRYVIPGFGLVDWPRYITHLRINGYDHVMSIEHEDATQTREEGFMRGAWYLEQFC
jgi:sugar phosphate isomerase/epimerase